MPHKFNHARRHKFEKAKYGVSDWRDYEAGLRRREDVTLWISESAIAGWVTSPGKRGLYSSLAIETSLVLRLVFGPTLRQTEGFVGSILRLLDLDLPVPDHTTLSRRGPGLVLVKRKVTGEGASSASSSKVAASPRDMKSSELISSLWSSSLQSESGCE